MKLINLYKILIYLTGLGLTSVINKCEFIENTVLNQEANIQKINNEQKQDSTEVTREQKIENIVFIMDSINATLNWKKVKTDLYVNNKEELGFKYPFATELGFTYNYMTTFCDTGEPIAKVIDTTTFKYLGSTFYKDKKHIYHYFDMAYGGRFYIYDGVDHKTFKVIGDSYAKDKNHIYGERAGIMENVDYATFTSKKGAGPYAKDKNNYYFWDNIICTRKELRDSIKSNSYRDLVAILKKGKLLK